MKQPILVLGLLGCLLGSRIAAGSADSRPEKKKANPPSMVLLPNQSPLISFRILFQTGSAFDPPGKQGAAALTAAMLAKGGARELSYEQILAKMYPLAATLEWQVDKEMTVFVGSTHLDNLEAYYALIRSMLLEPGFREEDFTRLKADAINSLKVNLRDGNDEELGKEYLYQLIYAGHPYEHHNLGRIQALADLALEDVGNFYARHYTRTNLVFGLAGGYPPEFLKTVQGDFSKLPEGSAAKTSFQPPRPGKGLKVSIIQRETRSTAISIGFPIEVRRGHPDWPALALATSYFGQHRSSYGELYQRLRETRGMNYGDYAYIEYFPRGMFQFEPDRNLGRQQQIFQIWIRPVEPQNALFALRTALYAHDQLARQGLSREAFQATLQFLSKYIYILTQTQDARLGYALDSRYYGIGDFTRYLREALAELTLTKVNEAIRRHLKSDDLQVVMVTKEAQALKDALANNRPSPVAYNSPKPQEILDEDKIIEKYPLKLQAEDVAIIPVEQIFE